MQAQTAQALARGQNSGGEIRGDAAGAVNRRKIPFCFVIRSMLLTKIRQPLQCGLFSGREKGMLLLRQIKGGRGDRRAFGLRQRQHADGSLHQYGEKCAPERSEHFVEPALLCAHTARRQQNTVIKGIKTAGIRQTGGKAGIAALFIQSVLFIDIDSGDTMFAAPCGQPVSGILKGMARLHMQGDPECGRRCVQRVQLTENQLLL